MAASCFYHPDQAATATCVQCGMPICDQDRETVADKTVCKRCVGLMRARVERELAADPAAQALPQAMGQPAFPVSGVWPPPPMAAVATSRPLPSAVPGIGRIVAGIGLSVVLGLIGTAIWLAIIYYTHRNILWVAIGVGWLCGWGALKGCGQGGKTAAVVGGSVALVTTLIASVLINAGMPDFFSWLCVAVGVYEGYIVPTRAAQR